MLPHPYYNTQTRHLVPVSWHVPSVADCDGMPPVADQFLNLTVQRHPISLPCPPQVLPKTSPVPAGLQDNAEAQQKFQEISTAYDTLRDPQKRSMYDRVGPEGMEQGGGMGGFGVSFDCQ